MTSDNFLTKAKFSKLVENTVLHEQLSYIDCIVHLCDKHTIDIEDVRKYLSPSIKAKIEAEAMNLNYLPKGNTLPVE